MLSKSSGITTERLDARAGSQEAQQSLPLSARTLSAEEDPRARRVELKGGATAWVDADMVDAISIIRWSLIKGYASGYVPVKHALFSGRFGGKTVRMHRLVLSGPPLLTDHINRNTLDNRRVNLRLVSHLHNSTNRGPNVYRRSSQYKGVTFYEGRPKPWYMRLKADRRTKRMHSFVSERDAAIAYDIFAGREWAEYAALNVPDVSREEISRVQSLIDDPKRYQGSSKYVGVTKIHDARWVAKIKINGKHFYITSAKTERDAAAAYNAYAIARGGPEHSLNAL